MAKRFTLVGPNAGQTIKLGKYQFEKGVHIFPGSDKDAETLANVLANFYSAYPDDKLEAAQAAYEAAVSELQGKPAEPAKIVSEKDDKAGDEAEKKRLEELAAKKAQDDAAAKAEADKKAADDAAAAKAEADKKAADEAAAKKAADEEAARKALEGGSGGEKDPLDPPTLAEVIQGLDPSDDTAWSARGLPSVDVVGKLFGKDVSRADIEAAAPEYTRAAAKAAKAAS